LGVAGDISERRGSSPGCSAIPWLRHRKEKRERNGMRIEVDGSGAAAPPPAKSPAPTPDTSPEKAWTDAVAQAKANAPQQSVTAKPGDTLTGVATSHHDTVQDVIKANPQIADPSLIHVGETIYLPKTTPAQVVTGVDNTQIQPIITAMANANSDDEGLQQLQTAPFRNRATLQDAQAQSAQSWDTVEQITYNMLVNNNGGAYPEQAAVAEVKQLNALEPGNAKFAAANNAALAEATQQWQQMGITKPQLSPIINTYDNLTQTTDGVKRYLRDPSASHNRAIVQDLLDSEQQARTQLNTVIEKSLTDAANQAGPNPQARSKAMTERAMNIQLAGPQDSAFQTAVDNANYDLQVTKPAEAVADAYAKGGAPAAAQTLKTVTQNAGNGYYAAQIIQASQSTIDGITKELGSLAKDQPMPSRADAYQFGPSPDEAEFSKIYSDLSQAVAAAGPISVSPTSNGQASVSLSANEKAAADVVANSIARNAPKDMMPWQAVLYSGAASDAMTSGDGPAMTLATAAAAKTQGNAGLASYMVDGITGGIRCCQVADGGQCADGFCRLSKHDLEQGHRGRARSANAQLEQRRRIRRAGAHLIPCVESPKIHAELRERPLQGAQRPGQGRRRQPALEPGDIRHAVPRRPGPDRGNRLGQRFLGIHA
jgi:LysM repeat protein